MEPQNRLTWNTVAPPEGEGINQRLPSSLSDLKNRSDCRLGEDKFCELGDKAAHPCLPHLPVLQVNSRSIDQKSGETGTGQADLQPISFKSDRLLVSAHWQ